MAAHAVAPVAMMGSRRMVRSEGAVDAEVDSGPGVWDEADGKVVVVLVEEEVR